jgi:hypothetical protein
LTTPGLFVKDDSMSLKDSSKLGFAILCWCALTFSVCGAESIAGEEKSDPCSASSPTALFAFLDRPTFSDSACPVPFGHAVLEMGLVRATLRGEGGGRSNSYPQAELRFGLPGRNEFKILAPTYTSQRSGDPREASSGFSATALGLKHGLGYSDKWTGSVEAIITLPSGNADFGSRGSGATLNGIAEYSVTDQVALSMQLGLSSLTESVSAGGKRFTSFNQFITATWNPVKPLQFYGEFYGQTKTSSNEGVGYNFDGGIQFLVTRRLEVDVETGIRLTGHLGGFTHFYGAGIGILF